MTIRVIVADDHPFIRVGIRNILEKNVDICVVAEAGDGIQALKLVDELVPDVLLLDMEMPGMCGLEVAQTLKMKKSPTIILALSAHEDKQYILGMLSSGAAGYLIKDEVPDTILKAIKGVVQGERGWVSRRVAARIGVWMQGELQENLNLSQVDLTMLRLMLYGKNNDEIGAVLGVSENAIEINLERAVQMVRDCLKAV